MAEDDTIVEGAELRLGASGPMPVGAARDFRALLASAYRKKRQKLPWKHAEELAEIENPVIASAFVLADGNLAKIEQEAIRKAEELAAAPPPTDQRAKQIAHAAESVREVAREAERDGVRFTLVKPRDEPPAE